MILNWKNKHIENMVIVSIITIFMGQIYISPVTTWFRFSFAVIVLPIALLFFKDIPVLQLCTPIGLLMTTFRAFVDFLNVDNLFYMEAFYKYFPVTFFYISYGFFFIILDVRGKKNHFSLLLLSLWICDSTSNILELSITNIWPNLPFKIAVLQAILIGLVRAFVVYFFYILVLHIKKRYDNDKKEKEYKDSLLFVSKLKTEVFFLKKSIKDIEYTMEQSYILYDQLKNSRLKKYALEISLNIHEIKKDYFRVVSGIENSLQLEDKQIKMTFLDVMKIIEDSTKKSIQSTNKNIYFNFKTKKNIELKNYVSLISIINNLIINSIEAIEKNGFITVENTEEKKNLLITITDNGTGIEKEDLKLIFQPGFSTKYDEITGKMSTGIGLSHVKNLVEEYYEGKLDCVSIQNVYTCFTIKIPIINLI
ncbi:MAG: ATP-binding protein [Psychrilyobacter sp.]|uniref:ATP-binding protein n=1 Tax=Psychrilyobacter sp. TaxID=2586924 RepID=UPI003C76CF97